MKIMPLLLSCIVIVSTCNHSTENTTPAPSNTQATPKKLLDVRVGGKIGYIDRAGKLVINPQYDAAFEFTEGLAAVCIGLCDQEHWQGYRFIKGSLDTELLEQTFKYGYIDETGKMVVNPMFESAESFSEGLAGVCVGSGCYYQSPYDKKPKGEGKWGFIDKTGTLVVLPQFGSVSMFHEGVAAVSVGDKWGYIDKTGKFVINPQYDTAGQFDAGIAQVSLKVPRPDSAISDYQIGYIDRNGKYIWQPSK
jgi:hypothetical protein